MDGKGGQSANGITESDPGARTDLAIWFFLQIAANHVGLPILVATFHFSKAVRRDPTLVNMCITWIIAGISSCLLLYAGKETGPEPAHGLCLLQASLLYGMPPMTAISALALVFTVWSSVNHPRGAKKSPAWLCLKLVAPYIALFSFAIATAVVGAQNLHKVSRDRRFFYCSVDDNTLTDTMAMFTAIVCFLCLVLEVWAAVKIYRTWSAFRAMKENGTLRQSGYERSQRGFDRQLVIRLFIFSGYIGVAMIFNVISLMSPKTAVPDIFAASIGMAVLIIFGTQMDIFRAWAFWLPSRRRSEALSQSSIMKEPDWSVSCTETGHNVPEGLDRAPTPPPKDFITISGAQSASDPLQDASLAETQDPQQSDVDVGLETGTHRSSLDATTSLRGSLQSRKGDSVIIIQRPEEAFRKLGEINTV